MSEAERKEAVEQRLRELTPPLGPERGGGERPRAVILGGQPGAGKTTTQEAVYAEMGDDRTVLYDGDDNAEVHPRYEQVMREHGLEGNDLVNKGLPDDLHQKCMDRIRGGDPKYDVIASHPLGKREWAESWVKGFSDQGYHVSVVYLATHESNSLLGIADRYQKGRDKAGTGRWIDPTKYHDPFYRDIPDVAHYLESQGLVDSMYVVNRNGDLLYENHRGPDGRMREPLGARETIDTERNRQPTEAETAHVNARISYLGDPERRVSNALPGHRPEPVHAKVMTAALEAGERHARHREASAGVPGPEILGTGLAEAMRREWDRDARSRSTMASSPAVETARPEAGRTTAAPGSAAALIQVSSRGAPGPGARSTPDRGAGAGTGSTPGSGRPGYRPWERPGSGRPGSGTER
ncbi:zeta toxin family protein [Nocardiopsis changdeensis]|uniref:UDP-N-acetylglucosamine kinase n=1 Tax=Nocardiopsis changdeensis TaxID=2831969 RepID=A0ABX8BII4_9ACTN|nr:MULTISPECIES: zeta toxin family protein [Nocardiopsis]QUX21535.1 zeta toxin family protein [Nocardiopsis changdeensis]QYX37468.1 zeta toxin family protein [Nocardiopsis sp. MT53]